MLLDDRRIVLSLEAICWCTAAMVFFQQTDFPSAIAILPLLMAVLIHVEYATWTWSSNPRLTGQAHRPPR